MIPRQTPLHDRATENSEICGRRRAARGCRICLYIAAAVVAAAHDCSGADAPGVAQHAAAEVLAEFDVEKDGASLVIPVSIELPPNSVRTGRHWANYDMVLDTGAPCTVIDESHRADFGEAVGSAATQSPFGALQVQFYSAPTIRVGRFVREVDTKVVCFDLRSAKQVVHRKIDGILGMDVLAAAVLSVDFDAGRLRFHTRADARFGRPVKMTLNSDDHPRCPVVTGALDDGESGSDSSGFLVDTGASVLFAGGVKEDLFGRLEKAGRLSASSSKRRAALATGSMDMRFGRVSAFVFAGYMHKDLVFAEFPVNCLGLGYLSRYAVLFDFPNERMYLRPAAAFSRADVLDLSGLTVARPNGATVVSSVTAGTSADLSGIRKGDSLVAIDGRDARHMSIAAIQRALSTEGSHTLVVHRGGAVKQILLKLRARESELPVIRGANGKKD